MAAESNISPPFPANSLLSASALFLSLFFFFYGDIKLVLIVKYGIHINVVLVKGSAKGGKQIPVCSSALAGSLAEKIERMEIVNPVMCLLPCRILVLLERVIRIAAVCFERRRTEVEELIIL